MAATKKLRYSLGEEQHLAAWEAGADVEYEDAPPAEVEAGTDPDYDDYADPDYEEASGEASQPGYEYESAADPDYADCADPEYEEEPADWPEAAGAEPVAEPERADSAAGFAFAVGRPVLPLYQQQAHPVLWRGQLKERHPATGLVQRVPVYRLDDGHWDCYREDELQAA